MTWHKTLEITLNAREARDANSKKPKTKQVKIKPIYVNYFGGQHYGACFEYDGVSFIIDPNELISAGEKIKKFNEL